MRNARRFLETVAHLSARQIAVRAAVVARRRWWRATGARFVPSRGVRTSTDVVGVWPKPAAIAQIQASHASESATILASAENVSQGTFSFLGRTIAFADRIDWHSADASQLWRYHLQYFGWVPQLVLRDAATSTDGGYATFRSQVRSWIRGNTLLRGDGWHPYTLSLRCVNWLRGLAGWRSQFEHDVEFLAEFLGALHGQVRRLEQQLEFDVRGNHLMENARALYWAGTFLKGVDAERWRRRAESILSVELAEQVLADGAHFERTPGYHTTMLSLVCDLAILRVRNGIEAPRVWLSAVHRMAQFLKELLGPDGRLPLIKDTAYDAMACSAELLHVAAVLTSDESLMPQGPRSLAADLLTHGLPAPAGGGHAPTAPSPDPQVSGFFTARGGRADFVVIDCGAPCPEYLPAHAHADSLSYEFHSSGKPLVVDSGVFEYARGRWRDYFRSTRAHNTVEVDGRNSSDVWSSFRVGRRARVMVRDFRRGEGDGHLIAEHDGYARFPRPILHRRCFVWRDAEYLLVLDSLVGRGTADLVSYVHLHPSVVVQPAGSSFRLSRADLPDVFLHPIRTTGVDVICGRDGGSPQGWYSEQFGQRVVNNVLALSGDRDLPGLFGYALSPDPSFAAVVMRAPQSASLTITTAGATRSYRWDILNGTLSS